MIADAIPDDWKDDAYAADMQDYLAFIAAQPDPPEYCAALALDAAIDRAEEEGIARTSIVHSAGA
jgi:hypothetical protein